MKHWGFAACLLLLAVYVLHTIWGKLATLGVVAMPFALGEVGEFLVVLAAMFAFVVGLYALDDSSAATGNG